MIEHLTDLLAAITLRQALLSAGLFVAMFALSLLEVGFILVKLPEDYFADHAARSWWADKGAVPKWLGIAAKNLLGLFHVALGVLLSLPGIPGQGLLTILIGVAMLDLPGMRRLERRIISMPKVRNAIDRLRARYHRPPLVVEENGTKCGPVTPRL